MTIGWIRQNPECRNFVIYHAIFKINVESVLPTNIDSKYVLKVQNTMWHYYKNILNLSQDLYGVICVSLKIFTEINMLHHLGHLTN